MNKIKTIAICIFSSITLIGLGATPVLAADSSDGGAKEQIQAGFEAAGGSSDDDLMGVVTTVINTMLFIVGVLAVIMIIYSGIRYVTAHGDKGQVESAKNTLIYSIVGLVIAIIAYAIVNFVLDLF